MLFKVLKNIVITILTIGTITLSGLFYFDGDVKAAEETKIYICNCPGGCLCEYETKKPGGRCVCGLATIPSEREPSDELEYECDCGNLCDCGSGSDEPGLCHCGITKMREKK
ncbi:MAG: hypothetical protein ACE5KZ_05385 [Candidatus Scalinduaceae bacterium]